MKHSRNRTMRRFVRDERGQSLVIVAVVLFSVMALSAAGIETGHIYFAYHALQAATNAATLAGAHELPTALGTTTTQSLVASSVNKYSCASSGYNTSPMLSCSTPVTTLECLGTVTTSFNVGCETPPGGVADYNGLKVTQTATVNLWFGGLVGVHSLTMSATGTAAMAGGTNIPYNLAIVMDTTASMADTMTSGTCSGEEQITCAVNGLTTMLEYMYPCALNTTCSSGGAYVDDVSLFVFPAISTTYKANDYKTDYCYTGNNTSDSSVPYNFQNVSSSPGNYDLATVTTNGIGPGAYELIPFENTYKSNDSTTNLTVSDALAEAVGYTGTSCPGLGAPGGQGTFYAQVIYQAQQALVSAQTANPGSKNIMIILSDGDATATNPQISTGEGCTGSCSTQIVADNCPSITTANGAISSAAPCASPYTGQPLNGTNYSYTTGTGKNKTTVNINPTGYLSPSYPSALGECGQAVYQAQQATAAGTTVYAIAFDSEISGGCLTDQTYTSSVSGNGAESWPNGGTYPRQPCNAIAAMASNENTFYSDYTDNTKTGGKGCQAITATNQAYQSLAAIFKAVVQGLTAPRLVPNGTT
jgi:Flp pilus assembly protein TadG